MVEDTFSKEEIIRSLEGKAEFLLGEVGRTKNSPNDLLISVEGDVLLGALNLIRSLQYDCSSASKASEEWKAKYEAERKDNAELKKPVDELYCKGYEDGKEFAEKFYKPLVRAETRQEMAKEIWNRAYKIACNTRGEITEQSIKEIAKRNYGVEVEE